MSYGLSYEELEPGTTYRHWPGKTITESENHLFCLLTMATSPLHTDAAFAASDLEGGKNLVIGTLIYALLVGMSLADVTGQATAALGVDELRHLKPMHPGDTLYGETTILEKRPSRTRPSFGVVTAETIGRNQEGNIVCRFRRAFLIAIDSKGSARPM